MRVCVKCGKQGKIMGVFDGKYNLCFDCVSDWVEYYDNEISKSMMKIIKKTSTPNDLKESNRVWETEFLKFLKHEPKKIWSVS